MSGIIEILSSFMTYVFWLYNQKWNLWWPIFFWKVRAWEQIGIFRRCWKINILLLYTDKCPTIYGPSSASREREMTFRARVFYCLQTAGNPFFTIFRSIFFHCWHGSRGSKGLSSRHDLLVDEGPEISGNLNFFQREWEREKKGCRALVAQAGYKWLAGRFTTLN